MTISHQDSGEVAIIGAGGWGTALAILLSNSGKRVRLWLRSSSRAKELRKTRLNNTYLPGVSLPRSVEVVSDIGECTASDFFFFATPSSFLSEIANSWCNTGAIRSEIVLVSCSKGIELGSGRRMTQVLTGIFPENPIAVLSGPNHAEEIARGVPAASVLGSTERFISERVQRLLSTDAFRVYTSDDIPGIELGGALKNIFGLAAGISDGLGLGDNTKAALITRSLAEMIRIGLALGGRRETFYGLSGIGDLMATCFSRHSRNRRVGERLGRGEIPEEILRSMQMVVEGVPTTRSISALAAERGLSAPIVSEVAAILFHGQSPADAMRRLLSRDLRPEED
jgi:glycerol-3-phosphate dehydrogenase (NAD(P)+)